LPESTLMSSKFFTNSKENTLLEKFKGVFGFTKVAAFDVLVGYFRSSGYFRIRAFLKDVPRIRILVGINVDQLTEEAATKGLEFKFNSEETTQEFLARLKDDIQSADYSKDVEQGIIEFIHDVSSGKIQIKAHPDKNIHAKIYIFRPEQFNSHNSGSVITGSSNLSVPGLETNFEFNVELRDFDEVAYATKTFDALWEESIEITPTEVEATKATTYLNESFTPFEIYIKFLIEYFGKSIDYDPESIEDLPKGYKKLRYQVDAVNEGYQKLMKHNGFFLSDVVGLGKTIVAAIIAKKFYWRTGPRTKTLIVHTPPLEGAWKKVIYDFDVPGVEFITNGSLHKVSRPDDYDLIIVDEAHKFRSDESEMFNKLQKLCKTPRRRPALDGSTEKKVVLITATPLNNRPEDIRNQIYLFQDSKQSTLEIGNLQHFFRPLIDDYKKIRQLSDKKAIASEVKRIYDEIRNKVLQPLIVRRTRTDLRKTEEYKIDIAQQGVKFPDIEPPRQVLYELDAELDHLYDETFTLIRGLGNGLKYFRYQAIKYLKDYAKGTYKQADLISEQLAVLMKTLLVKRMDSSFHAFKMSLHRYHDANSAMLKMFDNNRIYIAPKLNVNEFIQSDNEAELVAILEESDDPNLIRNFVADDFRPGFIEGLRQDQIVLDQLVNLWHKVEKDPKLDKLVLKLKSDLFSKTINDNGKLIIFSESKETTNYLFDELKKKGFDRLLAIDSSNIGSYVDLIAENFDANYDLMRQKDDFNILITTEVLAEGVNLHRSNIIMNYDIPWNATRLMQRIGRVNRIGTKSPRIYIYNFFPTVQADNDIDLNKRAFVKLQGFHSALGEDSQIYTEEEQFDSFGLFEKVPEEDRDERLAFLSELRLFKQQYPEQFKKIQNMPKRARVGRKEKTRADSTIAYIKNTKRDSFYYCQGTNSFNELTFVEAAGIFEAKPPEKTINIHGHHYDHISLSIQTFKLAILVGNLGEKALIKLGPNETRAIAFVGTMLSFDFVSENERKQINSARDAIKVGRFQKLPREINKLLKKVKSERIKPIDQFHALIKVLGGYPLLESSDGNSGDAINTPLTETQIPEIIISESFS
jgi:superfamily II DNA/RNA helicase/HKD family nuclease